MAIMGHLYRQAGPQTIELLVMRPNAASSLIDRTGTRYQDERNMRVLC
jgi:hypothetical protein